MASYEDNDETSILIYQCAKCLTILGDSMLEKVSNDELGVVGLTEISPDVIVKADSNLGHRGVDEGWSGARTSIRTTYRMLRCQCDQPIGKIYLKTTKKFQNLVNLYCLKQNQLVIYKVGTAQTVNLKERDRDDSIRESFAKMEKMIILFHSRLKNLEDSLGTEDSESSKSVLEKNDTLPQHTASSKTTDMPKKKL